MKAKGLLRLLCTGTMHDQVSTRNSAEEIRKALLNEFEGKTIFDKIYCLHDPFFTQLENDTEEGIRKYMDLKSRKFAESQRLELNLPQRNASDPHFSWSYWTMEGGIEGIFLEGDCHVRGSQKTN